MSNMYHCQWLPISEYFSDNRQYIIPVWVRYKNESGNYDMAMGWYNRNHWQEQYSKVKLENVTDFMELPMMPMKKEWRVFGTDEDCELNAGEYIKKGRFEELINEIEKMGWNIHSFVSRKENNHHFIVTYRYVPCQEEKVEEKGVSPSRRIEIAGGDE